MDTPTQLPQAYPVPPVIDIPPTASYQPKDGVKTTEFWMMIFNTITGMLVMTGIIDVETVDQMSEALKLIIAGCLMLIPNLLYIWSRIALKRQAAEFGSPIPPLPLTSGVQPQNIYPSTPQIPA